ncbi:hypothetical protein ACFLUN_00780 [Chloroflexota bacterium]
MDDDRLKWIDMNKTQIIDFLAKTKFEKLFPLPNRFLNYYDKPDPILGEIPDPRSGAILYLSWLLTDLGDYESLCTPIEVGELLKSVGEAIISLTEPAQI